MSPFSFIRPLLCFHKMTGFNPSPDRESTNSGSATITFKEGKTFDFKSSFCIKTTPGNGGWSIGLAGTNNFMLYLQIYLASGLKPGKFNGYAALSSTMKKGIEGEKYNSYCYENQESGKMGQAIYEITKIRGQNVMGTFEAILYSEKGRKVVIKDGCFDVDLR